MDVKPIPEPVNKQMRDFAVNMQKAKEALRKAHIEWITSKEYQEIRKRAIQFNAYLTSS